MAKKKSPKPEKLSAKQTLFVSEYLKDLNATQAAIRAGYSEKTARVIGAENLTKPAIAVAVEKAQEDLGKRNEITQDRVIKELALLGFANMADYMKAGRDGAPTALDFGQLTREQTAALQEVTFESATENDGDEVTLIRRTKFKLYDKRAALVDIGRHLGMFKERVVLEGDPENALRMVVSRASASPLVPPGAQGPE